MGFVEAQVRRFDSYYSLNFGKCPGGEGAVLKTVGSKGLAGSNPVLSVTLVYSR